MSADSRLGDNILFFCRTLRAAGVPVGPAQVVEAMRAAVAVGIRRRDDLRAALAATLVTDPAQAALFRQAFAAYFRNPRLLERVLGMLLPSGPESAASRAAAGRRLAEALRVPDATDARALDADTAGRYSRNERLTQKDFEQMTAAEAAAAEALLRRRIVFERKLKSRRFRPSARGRRIDLRRSMQLMIRNDGEPIALARRERRRRVAPIVLLCDISGSMSRYSRMFLLFAHTLSRQSALVHSFVFGTRLTNVTRRLGRADADDALAQIAADVRDFDGGTRIAECVARFNRDWGRRVLAQNATVVLLTDGLERDTNSDLEFQVARLHRSCRYLLWLNPMLRYDGFEARAFGIRAILPHVDRFLPAHNVDSLEALGELIGRPRNGDDAAAAS